MKTRSPHQTQGLLKMISFIHVLARQRPLPVHPCSSHQWWQRAKINSRKGGSIQAEMASFVLKDFGRRVLKNYAICGFFRPWTACAVDNASPTSITSANASSWALQSILPSRPWGGKVSSQTVPAICSPHPNSGRTHPKCPARPLPQGDGQDQSEQECPTTRPNPTICFVWSLPVSDVSSSLPHHPGTPVPSWDKPHMSPWAWESRAGLSLISGDAAWMLWSVHEISEDVFSALPGMTKKGYREYPNTAQGTQPCNTS